jgi:hypothetical protein
MKLSMIFSDRLILIRLHKIALLPLKLRFGTEGLNLLPSISTIEDVEQLRAVLAGLETASNLDELRQITRRSTTDTQPEN